MITLDTGALITLLSDKESDDRARMKHLVDEATKARIPILIPAPVLAEYLTGADVAIQQTLDTLRRSSAFRIGTFDEKAAVEFAIALRANIVNGSKRGRSKKPWQAVKFDEQIVAIAKANNATQIIASDTDVLSIATRSGLSAVLVENVPLPPEAAQGSLFDHAESPDSERPPAPPSTPG